MIRRYVFALLLLAALLVAIAGGSTSAGAAVHTVKPVTFTGKIRCTLSTNAEITSKPGLETSTAREVTITISGTTKKCWGETKSGGATIESGSVLGTVKGKFDCLGLASGLPNPKGFITWKSTGKPIAKTWVTLSAGTFDTTTGAVSYNSLQKGSFPGHRTVVATIKTSLTALLGDCGSSTGLTKIVLSDGAFT